MSAPDPVLEKFVEFERRFGVLLTQLDELERLIQRMGELHRAVITGAPLPPPPSVN